MHVMFIYKIKKRIKNKGKIVQLEKLKEELSFNICLDFE